jgi:DNA mismatch repair protein MSH5
LFPEKEIEIVYDMAQRILQYENVLVEASDVCGELDRYFLLQTVYSESMLNSTVSLLSHRRPAFIS